jgi:heme-degrading monooxygenase HmoA
MTEPAIFINCFEVPEGREEAFFAMWSEVNRYMREKPGFVSNRLHRATTPNARFRFINYVLWQTEADWRAAHDAGFRAMVQKPEWRDLKFSGAIFEVVSESAANAAAA